MGIWGKVSWLIRCWQSQYTELWDTVCDRSCTLLLMDGGVAKGTAPIANQLAERMGLRLNGTGSNWKDRNIKWTMCCAQPFTAISDGVGVNYEKEKLWSNYTHLDLFSVDSSPSLLLLVRLARDSSESGRVEYNKLCSWGGEIVNGLDEDDLLEVKVRSTKNEKEKNNLINIISW